MTKADDIDLAVHRKVNRQGKVASVDMTLADSFPPPHDNVVVDRLPLLPLVFY
jgi:hypothetical protein